MQWRHRARRQARGLTAGSAGRRKAAGEAEDVSDGSAPTQQRPAYEQKGNHPRPQAAAFWMRGHSGPDSDQRDDETSGNGQGGHGDGPHSHGTAPGGRKAAGKAEDVSDESAPTQQRPANEQQSNYPRPQAAAKWMRGHSGPDSDQREDKARGTEQGESGSGPPSHGARPGGRMMAGKAEAVIDASAPKWQRQKKQERNDPRPHAAAYWMRSHSGPDRDQRADQPSGTEQGEHDIGPPAAAPGQADERRQAGQRTSATRARRRSTAPRASRRPTTHGRGQRRHRRPRARGHRGPDSEQSEASASGAGQGVCGFAPPLPRTRARQTKASRRRRGQHRGERAHGAAPRERRNPRPQPAAHRMRGHSGPDGGRQAKDAANRPRRGPAMRREGRAARQARGPGQARPPRPPAAARRSTTAPAGSRKAVTQWPHPAADWMRDHSGPDRKRGKASRASAATGPLAAAPGQPRTPPRPQRPPRRARSDATRGPRAGAMTVPFAATSRQSCEEWQALPSIPPGPARRHSSAPPAGRSVETSGHSGPAARLAAPRRAIQAAPLPAAPPTSRAPTTATRSACSAHQSGNKETAAAREAARPRGGQARPSARGLGRQRRAQQAAPNVRAEFQRPRARRARGDGPQAAPTQAPRRPAAAEGASRRAASRRAGSADARHRRLATGARARPLPPSAATRQGAERRQAVSARAAV